ncbi:AraC family transcriptional regulator [Kibdelosporangium phytohabitans]|nr:AraC family transcriptional regulator [Kibdelosporangium phytohabitans]MBE1465747.1 AraC-like DNA-binding protein [Kibdelosporangium phytohabitans]
MEWVRYQRMADRPVETMHAHFDQHSYHMHSHDTYSFGLTELGAQVFGCRGSRRTSAAGMVMAFNPDEPHDGRAGHELGFTYRIIHIGPSLIADVLSDQAGRPAGLPLFAEPVLYDPVLADALDRMYRSLSPSATALAKDEALADTVAALVRRAALHPSAEAAPVLPNVRRARDLLDEAYLEPLGADDLADAAGCSRFALYRAFKSAYGMSPSDYQRQLRLRAARRLIVAGISPAEAASRAGFADQAHLTRWFRRCYGITPGEYQRA